MNPLAAILDGAIKLFGGGDGGAPAGAASQPAPPMGSNVAGGLGTANQLPSQANAQGGLGAILGNPLTQSLLAGYFSAIGSPKLAGWGGAMSRGGLTALDTYANASYNQRQTALQDAYYKRALAQAEKAEQTANAANIIFMRNPTTNHSAWVNKSDINALHVLAEDGFVPWDPSATSAMIKASGATDKPAKPILKDLWDPKQGRNVPTYVKPGPRGEVMVGGAEAPSDAQAAQASDGYVPIGESGLQGKGDKMKEETVNAIAASRDLGSQLMSAMEESKKDGRPGRFMDLVGTLAYKSHMGFQTKEDAVRAYTAATKQQLMGMAQKASGNRAFGFVKLIQDHFPDILDEASFKEGKLEVMFGKGGVVDSLDHIVRYGASDEEGKQMVANFDRRFKEIEARSGKATPQVEAGSTAAPPPPPVAIQGAPRVGPNGNMTVQGVDGKFYEYSQGTGWQLTQ